MPRQLTEAEAAIEKKYTPPLPKQLRDQMAEADKIRTPEGEVAPAVQQEPEQIPQPPQVPVPPEVVPAVQPQTPQQPSAPADDSWEQRARSTQGRLEQAMQVNNNLQSRVQTLENQIASLRAQGLEAPKEPPAPTPVRLVSEQEATDYGEEFLSVVGKRSREEFSPEFELLANRLAKVENRIDGVSTVVSNNTRTGLYQALASAVPNWREVNHDPNFHSWLANPDPYSGRTRSDMLQEAFSGQEANRVINFFRGFVEASGLPPTPQANGDAAPPLPGQVPGQGSGKTPLETFAAPGRARSAPQQLPPDKPVYTNAWIAKFMADKLAGKYRGRETDADAIEQDIWRAQHEGRIIP